MQIVSNSQCTHQPCLCRWRCYIRVSTYLPVRANRWGLPPGRDSTLSAPARTHTPDYWSMRPVSIAQHRAGVQPPLLILDGIASNCRRCRAQWQFPFAKHQMPRLCHCTPVAEYIRHSVIPGMRCPILNLRPALTTCPTHAVSAGLSVRAVVLHSLFIPHGLASLHRNAVIAAFICLHRAVCCITQHWRTRWHFNPHGASFATTSQDYRHQEQT